MLLAIRRNALVIGLFAVAFFSGPYRQLASLSMMPGEIGDAVLNNYFLENVYLYLIGKSASLVHLNFFYPFPYVLGFSDNLFGSALFYLIPRVLTAESDTAFQIWYLIGYVLNYFAAYFSLRQLGVSAVSASVGALIFTFALPVAGHSGHAQLHYRFGVPLSIAAYVLFIERGAWANFLAASCWLVWQFYCTIYIGFFLLFALSAITCVFCVQLLWKKGRVMKAASEFREQWNSMGRGGQFKIFIGLSALGVLLVGLFYPYINVSVLYGATRSFDEVASMLPRPQSYFISDRSWLWASFGEVFENIPMRHEHQMFVGIVPMLLAVTGVFVGLKGRKNIPFLVISGALGVMVLLTLYVFGTSVWYLLSKLPLASAIRAMTRIDLVLLFPVSYLAAVSIDEVRVRLGSCWNIFVVLLIAALLFEFSTSLLRTSAKSEWRSRVLAKEATVPEVRPERPILFFAQSEGPFYADELDAMWVSARLGVPTLNGYSGVFPPGYSIEYGNDCTEFPRRLMAYLRFAGAQGDSDAYRELASRVLPIGFSNCRADWKSEASPITYADREYSQDEIRGLSLTYLKRYEQTGKSYVEVRVSNAGSGVISAMSSVGKPVRLAWRYIESERGLQSGWNWRKNLPLDIPAAGSLDVAIEIDPKLSVRAGKLEISIVQEQVFWGHEIGVAPLLIDWKSD